MQPTAETLEFDLFDKHETGEWTLEQFVEMIQRAADENGGGQIKIKYTQSDWSDGYDLKIWSTREETPQEVERRVIAERSAQAARSAEHFARIAHRQAIEWSTYLKLKAKYEPPPDPPKVNEWLEER